MKKTNMGFTLAELLAVVIIVALLSSLSLGAYRRSVEESRFAEGLSAASSLVEAVNRSYFESQLDGETPTKKPKIKTLDIEMANQGTCSDYCLTTPRFQVNIEENGENVSVRAYRGTTSKYKYYIEMQPTYSSPKDQISCKGTNDKWDEFCQAMGYTHSLGEGKGYTKPVAKSS